MSEAGLRKDWKMLKKCFATVAFLAITCPAFAGSLKVHEWNIVCHYTPEAVCTIDVLIDVGYYICIENQDAVKLQQQDCSTNYCNSYVTEVNSNFNAQMSVSIEACNNVTLQDLTATIVRGCHVRAGITEILEVFICATNVGIDNMRASTQDQKIATMTISVVPVCCCCCS